MHAEDSVRLQELVNRLHGTSSRFGLRINDTQTEVHTIGKDQHELCIKLGDAKLQQSKDFVYLGGLISDNNDCDKDITRRIGFASSAVRQLSTEWNAKDLSRSTKLLVYRTLIHAIVLYSSETWTLKEASKHKLLVFEMSILRKIRGISLKDKKTQLLNQERSVYEQEFGINSATSASEILWTRRVSHGCRKIPVRCTPWENTRSSSMRQTKEAMVGQRRRRLY